MGRILFDTSEQRELASLLALKISHPPFIIPSSFEATRLQTSITNVLQDILRYGRKIITISQRAAIYSIRICLL